MQCIDFSDCEPALLKPKGESLVRHELFQIDKWALARERELAPEGTFAIVMCLSGMVECGGRQFKAGDFFLMPAQLEDRMVRPRGGSVSLLRVTMS